MRMIGRIGHDVFGDHLKASLSAAGVDVSAVTQSRSQPTGVALIAVESSGQNTIVVASGANMDMPAADVEAMRRVFRGNTVALFQLESPLETVKAALALAREEGLTTILDPAPAQPLANDLLSQVDILTPNEVEALGLLGRTASRLTPREAARSASRDSQIRRPGLLCERWGDGRPLSRLSRGRRGRDGGGRYVQRGPGGGAE